MVSGPWPAAWFVTGTAAHRSTCSNFPKTLLPVNIKAENACMDKVTEGQASCPFSRPAPVRGDPEQAEKALLSMLWKAGRVIRGNTALLHKKCLQTVCG